MTKYDLYDTRGKGRVRDASLNPNYHPMFEKHKRIVGTREKGVPDEDWF